MNEHMLDYLTPEDDTMQQMSEAADAVAQRSVFVDYAEKSAPNTIRRHRTDLDLFAQFLNSLAAQAGADTQYTGEMLQTVPSAWRHVTHGILRAFQQALIQAGYAMTTINMRMGTIRLFCRMAYRAGVISGEAWAAIDNAERLNGRHKRNIDERREAEGIPTRIGAKKEAGRYLAKHERQRLKAAANGTTARAWRDRLIVCLLMDHGLRRSEVADLRFKDIEIELDDNGEPKNIIMRIRDAKGWNGARLMYMSKDTREAFFEMISKEDTPFHEYNGILPRYRSGRHYMDKFEGWGMKDHAVYDIFVRVAKKAGLEGVSPHDGRHTAATRLANEEQVPLQSMMRAFGWRQTNTAMRYVGEQRIANANLPQDVV